MSGFAIRYPFFIIMMCLIIMVVGVTTMARMPVDLFPEINIPVVVVATFYSGMPPEQIEANITNPFERFFTLGSGIDHIESRSLTGSQPDQDLFSAGNQSRRGRQRHLEFGHGAIAPIASGHASAGSAEVRRLQPAGVSDHAEGSGTERDRVARPGAVHSPQPDCKRSGSVRAAAFWRQVPPDSGLR